MRATTSAAKNRKRGERGMTLLEVLLAGAILTIGLLSLMGLASVAIQSNARNRMDGTSNMLAQQVLEHIHYQIGTDGTNLTYTATAFKVKDCFNNEYLIESEPGGVNLSNGSIDFSQTTPPTNYHMNFAICSNPTTSSYTIYDVRWNIQTVGAAYDTYLITVGAKPIKSSNNPRMYALPTNIRALVTGYHQ